MAYSNRLAISCQVVALVFLLLLPSISSVPSLVLCSTSVLEALDSWICRLNSSSKKSKSLTYALPRLFNQVRENILPRPDQPATHTLDIQTLLSKSVSPICKRTKPAGHTIFFSRITFWASSPTTSTNSSRFQPWTKRKLTKLL